MYYYRHPSIHTYVQHGGVPGTPTNIKQEQETTVYDLESILLKVFRRSKCNIYKELHPHYIIYLKYFYLLLPTLLKIYNNKPQQILIFYFIY